MILRHAAARHGRRALAGPVSRSTVRNASTDAPTDPPTASEREPPASSLSFSPHETSAWAATLVQKSAPKEQPLVPKVRSSRRKQSKFAQDSVMQLSVDGTIVHRGNRWSKPHEMNGEMVSVRDQWKMFKKSQAETKKLGTNLQKRYDPGAIVRSPPLPEDVTLEMLMAAQTHMGHHTKKWNPANARYIYGEREGTHMIALETTLAHLRRACRVVEEVAYHGGIILFVGTRNGQMEIVSRNAKAAGAYQLFTKWAPGTITNRDVMLDGHGTKVVDENDKHLPDFERYDVKSRPLTPDLVVCLNPQENYTMLYECGLATIPTIGIIDTDTDPTWVTYGIPANDDSLRSVSLIGGVLGRAGQRGQNRRVTDSAAGKVPWQTPVELEKHIGAERAQVQAQRKRLKQVLAAAQGLNPEEEELVEQQTRRQNVVKEVNEDALLDIMGQAAAGERSAKSAKAPKTRKSVSAIDNALKKSQSSSMELTADIAALVGGLPPVNVSVESVDEQLASQQAQAQQLQDDIEASDEETAPLKPLIEELTPAAKKRAELEALFSGKKP